MPKLGDGFNDFLSRNGFESFAPTFLSAGVTSFDLLGEKSEEEVLEIMGGKKIHLRKMYGGLALHILIIQRYVLSVFSPPTSIHSSLNKFLVFGIFRP